MNKAILNKGKGGGTLVNGQQNSSSFVMLHSGGCSEREGGGTSVKIKGEETGGHSNMA